MRIKIKFKDNVIKEYKDVTMIHFDNEFLYIYFFSEFTGLHFTFCLDNIIEYKVFD